MPENRRLEILRIGHRPERDKRITTHVALTARAFGASGIYIDTKDPSIEENISAVSRNFGGSFFIKTGVNPKEVYERPNLVKIHLTMYGIPIGKVVEKIRSSMQQSDMIIIVGAEKVPFWAYEISDFNVSITSQPISEVSALAILMDRIMDGKELDNDMKGMRRVVPMEKGKRVDYIPDGEECFLILQRNNADQKLIDHVITVEKLATRIAEKCNANVDLVRAGALLHDIGRTISHGIDHAVKGAEILRRARVSDSIVNIVERHTGAGITPAEALKLGLPERSYVPDTIEEKIVAQADNLVSGNRIITLQETIENYERKNLHEAAERIILLNAEIEKHCDLSIAEIASNLKNE